MSSKVIRLFFISFLLVSVSQFNACFSIKLPTSLCLSSGVILHSTNQRPPEVEMAPKQPQSRGRFLKIVRQKHSKLLAAIFKATEIKRDESDFKALLAFLSLLSLSFCREKFSYSSRFFDSLQKIIKLKTYVIYIYKQKLNLYMFYAKYCTITTPMK